MEKRCISRFSGFTLIELLVVVLIIGILAAVAVPQYQVTVMKSRTINLLPLMKAVEDAEHVYRLASGEFTTDFAALDIEMPGEILTEGCMDDSCFNTKDWQYGIGGNIVYANRVINGDTDNNPYFLQLDYSGDDGSLTRNIICFGEKCSLVCGANPCYVQKED